MDKVCLKDYARGEGGKPLLYSDEQAQRCRKEVRKARSAASFNFILQVYEIFAALKHIIM